MQMPTLVAHRGHAAVCPENTLPALESAVAAGARWVEVDVQLTADAVPVLLHDVDLERITGRSVSVFSLTAAELAELAVNVPSRFDDRFAELRAPKLASFAGWLGSHDGVGAFVELKPQSLEQFGRQAVVDRCLEALAPVARRVVPISFDFEVLMLLRDTGFAGLGWIVRGFSEAVVAGADQLGARWLFIDHQRLPPGPLPAGPWTWVPYEVGTVALARELLDRGATWLETMAWAELAEGLGGGR